MQTLILNPKNSIPPTHDHPSGKSLAENLPQAKSAQVHPTSPGGENASIYFIGTATTILEWEGIRVMTDPNFLHAGDHVHLGPGVTGTRKTNPAIDLHDLPRIDLVLLSHYHADHFDQKVEESLRRDLPIISTNHAQSCLSPKGFSKIFGLEPFDEMMVDIEGKNAGVSGKVPRIKVTGMPGKHVPTKPLQALNELLQAVPPTNGWMVELGYSTSPSPETFTSSYRIYISGDTLLVPELTDIQRRYTEAQKPIDLMLIHLGGTTLPHPRLSPMTVMVTMDAQQGLEVVRMLKPDIAVPIHYDDYDVFASDLDEFKSVVQEAYLDRGDKYSFTVKA